MKKSRKVIDAAILAPPENLGPKWDIPTLYKLFLYFGIFTCGLLYVPNQIWDPQVREVTLIIGSLGIWRYSWWLTHLIRAKIYARTCYRPLRDAAEIIWKNGWRPRHVHFMMTTFREERTVTEAVIRSITSQIRENDLSATLWLGSGDLYDEDLIADLLRLYANDLDLEYVIVRQNQPGKRLAIGLVLRAMSRKGIHKDDLIFFLDGDSILGQGLVAKCAPLFMVNPKLQALTTDEDVVCFGPDWVTRWLKMRFAQRRIAMQSHALSKRVLTLTGRMSVFRADHLTRLEFIRMLEADHLNHWLWGDFRFLSGDDKSTWYYMLKHSVEMMYVPDAIAYTVEYIDGSGMDRMVQNFRRWSGNMLRNGARAIALGPRKMPFFIWWCLVDQRIAMWTMLVSPVLAILTTGLHSPAYSLNYLLWIGISRMFLCLFLFQYMSRVDVLMPFILYFNQLVNASVKVYCLFRLSKQRWSNRGDQRSEDGIGWQETARNIMATYITTLYVMGLAVFVVLYAGIVTVPDAITISAYLGL